jgi:hypothetical protein
MLHNTLSSLKTSSPRPLKDIKHQRLFRSSVGLSLLSKRVISYTMNLRLVLAMLFNLATLLGGTLGILCLTAVSRLKIPAFGLCLQMRPVLNFFLLLKTGESFNRRLPSLSPSSTLQSSAKATMSPLIPSFITWITLSITLKHNTRPATRIPPYSLPLLTAGTSSTNTGPLSTKCQLTSHLSSFIPLVVSPTLKRHGNQRGGVRQLNWLDRFTTTNTGIKTHALHHPK